LTEDNSYTLAPQGKPATAFLFELIARLPDPADRRGIIGELTDEGLKLVDDAVAAKTQADRQLLYAGIDPADAQALEGLLRKLLSVLDAWRLTLALPGATTRSGPGCRSASRRTWARWRPSRTARWAARRRSCSSGWTRWNRKSHTVRPSERKPPVSTSTHVVGGDDRGVDDRAHRERVVDGGRPGAVCIGWVAS
jgi:hypothetical protein